MISLVDDSTMHTEVGVSFFSEVENAMKTMDARVAIDCEGVNLSRRGTLELICLKFEHNPSEFIVDLQGNNDAAKERVSALKRLFENDNVTKIIHDCKMDCDALVHHCDIKLTRVHDTSCFHEVLTGRGAIGLNDLLEYHSMNLNLHRDNNVYRYNYRFWEQRPLTKSMQERAVGDIASLLDVSQRQAERCARQDLVSRAVSKSMENSIKATVMSFAEVSCNIPTGRFIGRKGANLFAVQRRSGALVYARSGSNGIFFVFYPNQAALNIVKRAMGHSI